MSFVHGPTATLPGTVTGVTGDSAGAGTCLAMNVYRTSDLRPTDVLLGRGYRYQRYQGNVAFRSYVAQCRSQYIKSKRADKRRITSEIVAYVRAGGLGGADPRQNQHHAGGGRFLRPVSEEEVRAQVTAGCIPSKGDEDGVELWTDADDRAAFEKVQHQLRQLPKKSKGPKVRRLVDKFKGIGSSRHESTTSPSRTTCTTNTCKGGPNAGSVIVNASRYEVLNAPSEKRDEDVPTSPAAVAVAVGAARADLRMTGQSSSISTPTEHLDLLSPVDIFLQKESAMVPPDSVALDAKAGLLSPNCNLPKTTALTAELNELDEQLSPTLLETGKGGTDNDESLPGFTEPSAEQLLGQIDNFLGGVLEEEGRYSTRNTSDLGALDAKAELFLPNCDLPKKTTTATTTVTTEPNGINSIISPTLVEKDDVECAPIFTEHDEKAELETLTASDIRALKSDLRGITAGAANLCTAGDRVPQLLRQLEDELSKLPSEERGAYSRAVVECPGLVSDERKMEFLEREDNDPRLAAIRLARHWKLKLEIFGQERCFLPMTLDGAMRGKVEKMVVWHTLQLLPVTDTAGRAILYFDPSRRDLSKFTVEEELSWWWYILEVAAEDPDVRRRGFIILANAAHVQRKNFSGRFEREMSTMVDSALTIRLRAIHSCKTSFFVFYVIHPLLKYSFRREFRLRFNPYYGPPNKLLQDLESFCLPKDRLPKELGGEVVLDMKKWVEYRLLTEGSSLNPLAAMEQGRTHLSDGPTSKKVRSENPLPVDEKKGTASRVGRRDSFVVALDELYARGNLH